MTDSVVVEGHVKLRDGKKWKNRWLVLRKPSPVAGAGVFFLSCAEGEQISFLFDCIVRGISPTKGPFGLRPVLPGESGRKPLQLEKRLVDLVSFIPGDDRSLSSSSSDTSHSDASVGSRLTIWPEQSSASSSQESHGLAAAKGIHFGEEKTLAEGARGTTKPPPKPLRSRQLQEIGRQSSSDSGIATGSHSSYSGSFSSYAGSLDICHGDEFGSLLSLPLNLPSDQNLCTCLHSEPQRSLGSEYQVPSPVRHIYDTPRSLLQDLAPQGISDPKSQDRGRHASLLPEGTKDSSDETYVDFVSRWSDVKPQGQVLDSKSSELAPPSGVPADPCEIYSPHPGMTRALFSACPICGGLKPGPSSPGSTSRGAVGYSTDLPVSDRPHSETTTYVNIPVSPTSKKQLHYMELELQEPSTGIRGGGSTKYAQIDIAATETAHKVGTQHAQCREERLQELEHKKKGSQE
uniref:Docking protein 7 n=1 Tax=Chelonoidis abingdonii TaxID=106734 RepID=A0A8C0GK50_CHEAB